MISRSTGDIQYGFYRQVGMLVVNICDEIHLSTDIPIENDVIIDGTLI
jgi:hypothetical protein